MQAQFNIQKSINAIHHINKKIKTYVIVSTDTEKVLDDSQHPLMIKKLKKLGIKSNVLNLIKGIYEKPTPNFILTGKRPKVLPLKT